MERRLPILLDLDAAIDELEAATVWHTIPIERGEARIKYGPNRGDFTFESWMKPKAEDMTDPREEALRLHTVEARYKDLLERLGVNGHQGAVAEIEALRSHLVRQSAPQQEPGGMQIIGAPPCSVCGKSSALTISYPPPERHLCPEHVPKMTFTMGASPPAQPDVRDALRYRWLAENAVISFGPHWMHNGTDPASTKQPLDNAIDAAMQRSAQGEKPK